MTSYSAFSAFKPLSSPRHFLIAPTFHSQNSIAYSNHVQDIHSLREYREPGKLYNAYGPSL